jgi:hypothetical protein
MPHGAGARAPGGQGGVPPQFFDDVRDMHVRLNKLEAFKDGEAITIGTRIFRSAKDCETFMLQEVPKGVLNTYCYNMVSLLHRIQRKGTNVSATDEVANDAAVQKGVSQMLPAR